ncbi:MAG: hypothetical protein IID44_15430 [Planctomycetes bacterium]|nr:hypothetical protein [Planctomycetota bacterium]
MHIELPDEIVQRVKQRAALQEGIDAMNEGRVQDFEQFVREFRAKNGIAPDA